MPHARPHTHKKAPKRVVALSDLEHAKSAVLSSLTSRSGQRTYDHAIREFVAWYCSEPRAFNRTFTAGGGVDDSGDHMAVKGALAVSTAACLLHLWSS